MANLVVLVGVGFGLLLLPGSASAVKPEQIRRALEGLVHTEMLSPTSEFILPPTSTATRRVVDLLAADSRVLEAEILTKRLVSQVLHDDFVQQRVTLDQAKSLATQYRERLQGAPSSNAAGNLLQLLIPYVVNSGVCSGDPLSETGASCGFSFIPPEFEGEGSVHSEVSDPGSVLTDLRMLQPGSDLYDVLSGCGGDEACRGLSRTLTARGERASEYSPEQQRPVDIGALLLESVGISSAFASPGEGEYSGGGTDETYINAYGTSVRIPSIYGFYFKYKCGFLFGFSCDVWGEIYIALNFKYLVTGSDMMFAVLPMSFHCAHICFWGGVVGYSTDLVNDKWLGGTSEFDKLDYLLWAADKEYLQLRGPGTYIRHRAKGACGVIPMPYQTRLSHDGATAAKDQYPYSEYFDYSFHTSFQAPPTDPLVPLLSTNMDPVPTRVTAELPEVCTPLPIKIDFVWTYDLLMEVAWSNNVIFSGIDNLNPAGSCGADEFMTWYGAGYSGKRGLPTINWTAGFKGGHLPFL